MSAPVATVLGPASRTHRRLALLPTPLAANELGCQARRPGRLPHAGRGAEARRAGTHQRPIVLLGADPVGDWPGDERWRTALGARLLRAAGEPFQTRLQRAGRPRSSRRRRCRSRRTGTLTNLEGRTAASAAPQPLRACPAGYVLAAEPCWPAARRLGLARRPAVACSAVAGRRAQPPSPASPGPGIGERGSAPAGVDGPARPAAPHVAERRAGRNDRGRLPRS